MRPNPLPETYFCSVPLRSFGAVTPEPAGVSFTNLVRLTVFLHLLPFGIAYGIRTRVKTLKGSHPWPLDERDMNF